MHSIEGVRDALNGIVRTIRKRTYDDSSDHWIPPSAGVTLITRSGAELDTLELLCF